MTAPIALIVARAANGVIGDRGRIPWRIPEDMRRFKALTMGKPVVMGRKTWDSLPKKPLSGRTNIVVTRDRGFRADGATVVHAFDEALAMARRENPSEIAIVGGAGIYAAALPYASLIHLTEIHADFEGDTTMPPLNPAVWRETAREDHASSEAGQIAFSFVTLQHR